MAFYLHGLTTEKYVDKLTNRPSIKLERSLEYFDEAGIVKNGVKDKNCIITCTAVANEVSPEIYEELNTSRDKEKLYSNSSFILAFQLDSSGREQKEFHIYLDGHSERTAKFFSEKELSRAVTSLRELIFNKILKIYEPKKSPFTVFEKLSVKFSKKTPGVVRIKSTGKVFTNEFDSIK